MRILFAGIVIGSVMLSLSSFSATSKTVLDCKAFNYQLLDGTKEDASIANVRKVKIFFSSIDRDKKYLVCGEEKVPMPRMVAFEKYGKRKKLTECEDVSLKFRNNGSEISIVSTNDFDYPEETVDLVFDLEKKVWTGLLQSSWDAEESVELLCRNGKDE